VKSAWKNHEGRFMEACTIMSAPGLAWTRQGAPIRWILGLAVVGFAMSWLCAGMARLDGTPSLLAYLAIMGVLLLAYVGSTAVPQRDYFIRRWAYRPGVTDLTDRQGRGFRRRGVHQQSLPHPGISTGLPDPLAELCGVAKNG
jgi:hypothetical protein